MNTLTVRVMQEDNFWDKVGTDLESVMSGKQPNDPFVFVFPSIEQLTKVMLAPNRLNIINAMAGAGAMSIRELARRIDRDFSAVHRDVQTMLSSGILEHEGNKIIFPFTGVHFDFNLKGKVA